MMDSKQVIELVKDLEVSKNDNDAVLKILNTLDAEVVATEKLLRETKVGIEVNKFKKSTNPEISKLVRKIITNWKDSINKHKKLKTQNSQKDLSKESQQANAVSLKDESGASNEANKQDKYITKKTRNTINDCVDTAIYNDDLRDRVIKALYDALAKESEHPPQAILNTVKDIELQMHNLHNSETDEKAYRERYRIIYSNVISKNNPDLKHKITNGEVTAEFLSKCSSKDLAPEYLKQKMDEISKQNLFNAQGATIERSVTDRFTCGKCKEKKVSYYQLQTRSADEPLTTFCTCEACGNRWKFS
ncbi:hypothetical protein TPHA_0K01860 [Tetrapisispora phaffii CBS 4417]|uniref:Transcription elongation factor n=1 Tax=Tetrapisispora phaffii (strain ATCC 24235 / CBS 4417 / NBRC 1672 / NRRL Y-8282 / UCD 70-5) TaxID=1071381 RepID=G8BZJ0_TETPH|nr:hypothetical protein TPHA_0K01860 [Tetrapisispora phaffii CBS 4417]CCE65318.1 hypothetical protein TPHA_0K01860 [Tetrapisispora phaffii CBS 4417]